MENNMDFMLFFFPKNDNTSLYGSKVKIFFYQITFFSCDSQRESMRAVMKKLRVY